MINKMYILSTLLKVISIMFSTVQEKPNLQMKPHDSVFDNFMKQYCYVRSDKWTPIQTVHAAFHDYCKSLSPRPPQRPSYVDIINHLDRHNIETKGTYHFNIAKGIEIKKWP